MYRICLERLGAAWRDGSALFVRRIPHAPVRIAAVAGLAVLFLAFLVLQDRELRRERGDYNYLLTTNNWAVSQLEYEVERFLGALDRFMLGEADTGKAELSMRFDVLWSRLPVLLGAEETTEARLIEGTVAMLTAFAGTLDAVDPELALLQRGDRDRHERIRRAIASWRPEIRSLTMEVYNGRHFHSLAQRTREGYRRAELYQWAMLAVVAVLATFLGAEVLRSGRRARDEAAARRAAEAASHAKSTFLATMGHELRTPLNAIMGFSEIQERQVFGPVPTRYREYARHIHASAVHLLGVLDAILDMARMENRRATLHEEIFDPRAALDEAVRMIDAECERAGLALTVEAVPQSMLLRADPRMFRQIVLNLLSNAVKFTPQGGEIGVTLALDGGDAVLAVHDNGVGIAPEALPRVTEAFFQADQSHARKHQGTGLGLALVKGFAELHGGAVAVASTPGSGTRVAVRFPAERLLPVELATPVARRAGA